MSVSVNGNIEGFLRWANKEPERAEEAIGFFRHEGSQLTYEEMTRQAPERTGFLKRSISIVFTPGGFTVYPAAPYALFVEYGVRPHRIAARMARALRFEWRGALRFFRWVQHPGFPGRRFVERTREEILDKEMASALRRGFSLVSMMGGLATSLSTLAGITQKAAAAEWMHVVALKAKAVAAAIAHGIAMNKVDATRYARWISNTQSFLRQCALADGQVMDQVFPDGRAIPSPWARGPLMVTAATAILAGA